MKQMGRFIKITVLVLLMNSICSCNSWLDLQPQDKQTTDMFWNSKEEVEAVITSGYTGLRNCLYYFVNWGELRGDGLDIVYDLYDLESVRNLDILPTQGICNWATVYSTIGRANAVISYAPEVMERDLTMTVEELNGYLAEAVFIRSLCYFYLVRTFGEVPLILEPYINDERDYAVAKTSEEVILAQILEDLNTYVGRAKEGYKVVWQKWGRSTKWSMYALMADIYLWMGDYEHVLSSCEQLELGGFELLPKDEWFELYNPGNSKESIFELQFSKDYGQSWSYSSLFYYSATSDYQQYGPSSQSVSLFEENSDDIRGNGGSYVENRIWKYIGTKHADEEGENRDDIGYSNWIIYRYAEILLMKAEALILKGESNYGEAMDLVEEVRQRAGVRASVGIPASAYEALQIVMNERQREFLAEGKRWFDIVRMAKRDNWKYKDYLLNTLLSGVPVKELTLWRNKLSDVNAYYLPIYDSEIKNSRGMLIQNSYYAGIN